MHIGLLRLHLLVPASPIDPTLKFRVRLHDEQQNEQALSTKLNLRVWTERVATGGTTNFEIKRLEKDVEHTQKRVATLASQVTLRRAGTLPSLLIPAPSLSHAFFIFLWLVLQTPNRSSVCMM